jgi:HSP20 family molecular chaperone IbpA
MSDTFTEAEKPWLPSLSDSLHHRFGSVWKPAVDVCERDFVYTIVMEAPGVNPADVRVGLVGNNLVIAALRLRGRTNSGVAPHRVERQCGRLARRIALPGTPDPSSLCWQLQQGLLRISIRTGILDPQGQALTG